MDTFASLDATAQAELVRRKEVKPLELVDAAIARIERLNPRLNAVVRCLFDQARAQARGPLPEGPFSGVPFLLKDLNAGMSGVPSTAGSRFFADFIPPHDSELTARYKRAGLVILGKTNVPEFGLVATTEGQLYGPCRNPWDLRRSSGGSSGGSAVAVATGMVPFAHGGDGGGSIRLPASTCGLFGLKPTRGRNPLGPDVGDLLHGLVVEHALTRSVRDSAALLDATEGLDVGAPYAAPNKARPYVQEVGAPPGKLRIVVTTRPLFPSDIHPECHAAVARTRALLTELGHTVVEDDLSFPGSELLSDLFTTLWAGGVGAGISNLASLLGREPRAEFFEPLTWALYEKCRTMSSMQYLVAYSTLQFFARILSRKFEAVDAWLTPTLAEPPVPLGTFGAPAGDPLAPLRRTLAFTPFTPLANITGHPAMSVPLHWTPEGLPVGVHFIGRFGDEATLFRLAAQLEQARPWASRRPPLA